MNVEVSIKIEGIDAVDMAMLSDRMQEVFGIFPDTKIEYRTTPIYGLTDARKALGEVLTAHLAGEFPDIKVSFEPDLPATADLPDDDETSIMRRSILGAYGVDE